MQTMDITPVQVQKYKDADLSEAQAAGCDFFQLKYDGWNARIEIHYGWVTYYSKTGRIFKQFCYPNAVVHCVLYAEAMFGTQWSGQPEHSDKTYIYDVYSIGGNVVKDMSYRDRYSFLKTLSPELPLGFVLVQNHPLSNFQQVWNELVLGGKFEGVVFRNRQDKLGSTLYRHKATFTEDLRIVGYLPGDPAGKYSASLGALVCETRGGTRTDVGGGFSDEERLMFWHEQQKYLGSWIEAEARARFESGALRHANFIRLRPDLA